MDIWELLAQHAPRGCEPIRRLYEWSINYPPGQGPFPLLLDLIGYSEDQYGYQMYSQEGSNLGYTELHKLGDALKAYANWPVDVREYITALLEAESEA